MTRKAQEPTEITAMAFVRFLARGLNRQDAATYVGVSATHFDAMVRDGLMPQPKVIDHLLIWDRLSLDSAYHSLKADQDEPTQDEEEARSPKIYVVGIPGYVKIGFTTRALAQRIPEIQTGSPYPLTIIKFWHGTRVEEMALHARFAKYRARGEWFRAKGEIAEWVKGGCQP